VLITQGASGVRLITQDFDISLKPERDVRVVDVTFTGDSVVADHSLLVGSGQSVSDNLQLLNNTGAETVQKAKTQI
jgi:bifunctional ADP-heptose synthase (sugar kinase/adenylyltransferase)